MTLWGQNEHAHQARIDAIVASARAQSAAPVSAPARSPYREAPKAALAPSPDLVDLRLEEELAFVRRVLDSVGERLCDDPILLTRYETLLQSFDMLGQTLGHIASVVGAEDKVEAIDRIGMVELRARLQRGMTASVDAAPSLHRTASNPFMQH